MRSGGDKGTDSDFKLDVEEERRAALLLRLLRVIAVLAVLAAASSFLEPRNDKLITSLFYGAIFVWLAVAWLLVRKGRVTRAGWAMGGFFWLLIAAVTLLFGGMQGQNASTFAVAVLLVGAVVGARAALGMALLSTAWCAMVVALETTGRLPKPLASYSPVNAWCALSSTVLLTSMLLKESLDSLKRVNEQAARSASERDEVLRRSIQGQKMELVGILSSGIAHDFNNLLSVMTSSSGVLRPALPAGNIDALAALDDLDEATSRAVLMTRQLLSFGRAQVGEIENVNVSEVVQSLAKMLPRLLGSKVAVAVHVPDRAWVVGSRVGIEQIVLNLAVNARDAMPQGGRLEIGVNVCDGAVQLTAKDNGVGMRAEVQKRIFEPFFSTKSTGTGLGLSTVKHQVEQFGGTISVTSELNTGTTFTVVLPAVEYTSESESTFEPPPLSKPGRQRKGRILLVEDEPLVRRATGRMLRLLGYDVIPLADGREAAALFMEMSDISCIISDISMPRMDGEVLSERVLITDPDMPIIMMSGNREPQNQLLHRSNIRYLPKPVDAAQLISVLDELVR